MLDRRRTLRTPEELAAAGLITADSTDALAAVAERYAVAVTPAIADLIDTNNPDDPIAKQFVPSSAELNIKSFERTDPIGDERHSPVKGVVHRYRDRALLKVTHVCPVYCRFCFRRETVGPGEDQMLSARQLNAALGYIAEHKEIWEIILTGGDPLMLSPRRIGEITRRLSELPHVKVLRWHTRMPIADPERITAELVSALKCAKTTYVAIHVNHARELSTLARNAIARLADAGIALVSQSVLLRGVNDDAGILEELMRALVELRVQPYYVHHPDLAPGTSHFRLTIDEGQKLMRELRARASGLCLPHYVLDIPGGYSKANLVLSDVEQDGALHRLRDAEGRLHDYPHS
jgi:lysine 2,3-aminomutase